MRKTRNLLLILGLSVLFLVLLPHNSVLNQASEKPETESVKTALDEVLSPPAKPDNSVQKAALISQLQEILSLNQRFAVTVYDINKEEFFGISETEVFHAASVTKVLVATSALEEVEEGKYQLTTPLGNTSLQSQLKLMINRSSNAAWDLFNSLLGFKREQETADRLDLTGANLSRNHLTTRAVGQLLTKLYNGEVLTAAHRDLLFSYMQNTEVENRISVAIPKGINFYHKAGTFGGGIHDAAVVTHPKNPFILVIFTHDTKATTEDKRYLSIQTAAKLVYSYFDSI